MVKSINSSPKTRIMKQNKRMEVSQLNQIGNHLWRINSGQIFWDITSIQYKNLVNLSCQSTPFHVRSKASRFVKPFQQIIQKAEKKWLFGWKVRRRKQQKSNNTLTLFLLLRSFSRRGISHKPAKTPLILQSLSLIKNKMSHFTSSIWRKCYNA